MDTTGETVKAAYDESSDVLRVFVSEPTSESIAVPGGHTTVLVTDDLSSVVGIVFEHFTPMLRAALAKQISEVGEEVVRRIAIQMVPTFIPPVLRNIGPAAKDRVAQWQAMAASIEAL